MKSSLPIVPFVAASLRDFKGIYSIPDDEQRVYDEPEGIRVDDLRVRQVLRGEVVRAEIYCFSSAEQRIAACGDTSPVRLFKANSASVVAAHCTAVQVSVR